MSVQLTMITMLVMYWTCLHVSAEQSTEDESFITRDEVGKMLVAERQEMTASMTAAMTAARQETEQLRVTLTAVNEKQGTIIEGLTERLEGLEQENIALKHQITDIQTIDNRHDDDTNQIAFSVASSVNFGPVEVTTNVPYEIVYVNIGGGYSQVTDAFHAIVKGVYMVTATMLRLNTNVSVRCRILHSHQAGQTTLASLWGSGNDTSSSSTNSVILELEEGDYISVQLYSIEESFIYSSSFIYSTFSGFLVFT